MRKPIVFLLAMLFLTTGLCKAARFENLNLKIDGRTYHNVKILNYKRTLYISEIDIEKYFWKMLEKYHKNGRLVLKLNQIGIKKPIYVQKTLYLRLSKVARILGYEIKRTGRNSISFNSGGKRSVGSPPPHKIKMDIVKTKKIDLPKKGKTKYVFKVKMKNNGKRIFYFEKKRLYVELPGGKEYECKFSHKPGYLIKPGKSKWVGSISVYLPKTSKKKHLVLQNQYEGRTVTKTTFK